MMLLQRYPKYAIIEITNRCNLRCNMCDIWAEYLNKDFNIKLYVSLFVRSWRIPLL